jgi:hypothetical protein
LEPAPESRSQGAHPHLSRSLSTRSVGHFELSFRVLLQHTLDGWPIRSPADASQLSSRIAAHGSGPMWVATPSSQWTFTTYSLPVSRRTHSRCGLHTRAVTYTWPLSEGFRHFVTSMPAPVASGWSECRAGLAPAGEAPPFHGARGKQTFGPDARSDPRCSSTVHLRRAVCEVDVARGELGREGARLDRDLGLVG